MLTIIENMKQKPVYSTKWTLTWEDTVIEKNAFLGFWGLTQLVWPLFQVQGHPGLQDFLTH